MNESGFPRVVRRRSRAEADRLLSEYLSSGLTRQAFCAARGLSVRTLDSWRRHRWQQACSSALVPVEVVEAKPRPEESGLHAERALLAMSVRGGRRIEVLSGFDARTLERLVAVLEQS